MLVQEPTFITILNAPHMPSVYTASKVPTKDTFLATFSKHDLMLGPIKDFIEYIKRFF